MRTSLRLSFLLLISLAHIEAKASLACKMIWSDSFGQNNVVQVNFRKEPAGLSKDPLMAIMQSEIPNPILRNWITYVQKAKVELRDNDVRLLGQHGVNDFLEQIQEMKTGLRHTISRTTENKDLLQALQKEIDNFTELMKNPRLREQLRFAGIQLNPNDVTKPVNYQQPSREFFEKVASFEVQLDQVNKQLYDLRYRSIWNIRILGQFQNNRMRFAFLENLHKLLFDFDRMMLQFRKQNDLSRVDTSQILYLARQVRKSLIHTDFVEDQIRFSESSFFKSTREYASFLRQRIQSVDDQIDMILYRGVHVVDPNRSLAARLMEFKDFMNSYYPENTYDLRRGLKELIKYFEVNRNLSTQNPEELAKLRQMLNSSEAKLQKVYDSKEYFNVDQMKEALRLIRELRYLIS